MARAHRRSDPLHRVTQALAAAALALATAAGVMLAATGAVAAEPRASLELADLTSPEVAAAIRAGTTTILVPIGGTEQNGAHMALGKHNVRVQALAQRIAAALGDALVAPVIAYVPEGAVNPPTGHMRYPGTISVPERAFEQVLEGAARSFRAHGFRDIVFLGDHGDYQKGEQAVALRLSREWAGSGVRVLAVPEYYRASTRGFADLLRARGYADAEIGIHAGLADTSLALALAPRTVREAALAGAARVPGVTGDPRRASAALGEAGARLIVSETVAAIRNATRH